MAEMPRMAVGETEPGAGKRPSFTCDPLGAQTLLCYCCRCRCCLVRCAPAASVSVCPRFDVRLFAMPVSSLSTPAPQGSPRLRSALPGPGPVSSRRSPPRPRPPGARSRTHGAVFSPSQADTWSRWIRRREDLRGSRRQTAAEHRLRRCLPGERGCTAADGIKGRLRLSLPLGRHPGVGAPRRKIRLHDTPVVARTTALHRERGGRVSREAGNGMQVDRWRREKEKLDERSRKK